MTAVELFSNYAEVVTGRDDKCKQIYKTKNIYMRQYNEIYNVYRLPGYLEKAIRRGYTLLPTAIMFW